MDYTTVSNIFIDNYMPQANGEFVKIYLYLLRCMSDPDKDISISSIADRFDHTEKDVIRALRYFAGKGLLSIEYNADDELSAVTFLPINSEFTVIGSGERSSNESVKISTSATTSDVSKDEPSLSPVNTMAEEADDSIASDIPEKTTYTAAQLKKLVQNDDIGQLLYITQKYLGKTLTPSETSTILYIYDSLHFSPELIEFLIEYCVNNNHKSLRYIEKVAISWAKDEIDTVEKAKANTATYSNKIYSIMKAFGISGRNPVESEMRLISKWYNDYCFDNDIIIEACNRTMKAIHSPSFEYADSILRKWKEKKVACLADIEAIDEPTAPKPMKIFTKPSGNSGNNSGNSGSGNRFNDFPQRSYDFDLLEKQLMED